MALKHVLGILTFAFFLIYFHFSYDKKQSYLAFSICLIPVIDLHITPQNLGMLTVFDGISLYVLLYLFKDVIYNLNFKKKYFILFLMLSIVVLIGCARSEFFINSFISYFKFITIFIYSKLLIDKLNNEPSFVFKVIRNFKFVVVFGIVFIGIQYVVGLNFTYWDLNQNTQAGNSIRYPGFSPDPQVFSQFLGMGSFLFLIKLGNETKNELLLNKILLGLILIAIFITGGRSGLLGLCVGFGLVVLTSNNKFRFLAVTGVLSIYLIITYFPDFFIMFNREENVNDSYGVRAKIWNEALMVFNTSPIFGVGLDGYQPLILKYYNFGYYINDETVVNYGTESGYLKLLVEMGIFGFIISMLFVILPIIAGIKKFLKKQVNRNIFFLIAIVAAWATAFITSITLEHNTVAILLASVLCILIASHHPERKVHVS